MSVWLFLVLVVSFVGGRRVKPMAYICSGRSLLHTPRGLVRTVCVERTRHGLRCPDLQIHLSDGLIGKLRVPMDFHLADSEAKKLDVHSTDKSLSAWLARNHAHKAGANGAGGHNTEFAEVVERLKGAGEEQFDKVRAAINQLAVRRKPQRSGQLVMFFGDLTNRSQSKEATSKDTEVSKGYQFFDFNRTQSKKSKSKDAGASTGYQFFLYLNRTQPKKSKAKDIKFLKGMTARVERADRLAAQGFGLGRVGGSAQGYR